MADRRVTHTGKDRDGDITKLCTPGEHWSPRAKRDAISDIESESHSYFVRSSRGRSNIHVVNGPTGKYLRTDPDGDAGNNLDELPDC